MNCAECIKDIWRGWLCPNWQFCLIHRPVSKHRPVTTFDEDGKHRPVVVKYAAGGQGNENSTGY